MNKFKQLNEIKEHYSRKGNILKFLREQGNSKKQNKVEDILISYDIQTGAYIRAFNNQPEKKKEYCTPLAGIINSLGDYESIMEVGVGEATTLINLIKRLDSIPREILGFDISFSRIKFAKEFLSEYGISNTTLFTANLFQIPLLDNSVDIVYTSHSIEPNGGKEEKALKELYRISSKYLILLEPAYELADRESRLRMKEHGYITDLYLTAKKLGYDIIEHRLFDYSANPLNPTGIIIIEKQSDTSNSSKLRCPVSLTELEKYSDSLLYSKESYLAYPVIDGMPCLLKENCILATHLLTNYQEFKAEHKISIQPCDFFK